MGLSIQVEVSTHTQVESLLLRVIGAEALARCILSPQTSIWREPPTSFKPSSITSTQCWRRPTGTTHGGTLGEMRAYFNRRTNLNCTVFIWRMRRQVLGDVISRTGGVTTGLSVGKGETDPYSNPHMSYCQH